MTRQPVLWVVLAAYAVYWFTPRINRWLDRPPRPYRPDPWRSMHKTPTQVRIIRRGSGQELDRGQP